MNIEIGSEKKFSDFINNLNDQDKIALISHTDLDGIVAAKVVSTSISVDVVKFVDYEYLNDDLVRFLREHKFTKVIFTDLYIKDVSFVKSLETFAEILIMDHHLADKDLNSSRTTFIKAENGYCAGYLCYKLFSKLKNIDHIDWLVACSCISDYCHVKTSEWLTNIFEKYGDKFEIKGNYVRMDGVIWDLQETMSLAIIYFKNNLHEVFDSIGNNFGEIGKLSIHGKEVKKEIVRLVDNFEKEKQSFNGGFLYEFVPKFPCGSMVSTILSGERIDKIIITLRADSDEDIYHVSVRRQDKKQNMSDFLKSLVAGLEGSDAGGHVPAAGGHFMKKDIAEFKKRLGLKA